MPVQNDWRKSIDITFPVYRYHPPKKLGSRVSCRSFISLDSPRTYHGSVGHKAGTQHGGTGLSRDAEFPFKNDILPGGVLDSKGLHIPILDIDAPETQFRPLVLFALELVPNIWTYRYRMSFGEPEQLDLAEFKKRIISLSKKEKNMPFKRYKQVEAADSFYGVMEAEFEPDLMAASHKTVSVKNWIGR
ncbi:MAG: hypothetical protein OXC60_08790 [Litoreibacter sp.]|nr:hypothetical protein [Litoreibacter sp.]